MSHNTIKVNNIAVDSNNVPLSLSAMTSTPTQNQIITYNGTSFVAGDSTASKGYDLKFSTWQGDGGSGYNVTGSGSYAYQVGDYAIHRHFGNTYVRYNDTGFTANTATATNSVISNSSWMESVDIPSAGTYLVSCAGVCRSADITYQLESNAGAFSAKIFCKRSSWFGSLASGILTTTGTDIVRLVVKAVGGSVVLNDEEDQDFFTFNILKIG